LRRRAGHSAPRHSAFHREQNDDGGGRKQIAEILIEKHRNGPTGKVELFFDQDKSSFLSVDKSDFGDFGGAGTTF
jgi:hypothetical protein